MDWSKLEKIQPDTDETATAAETTGWDGVAASADDGFTDPHLAQAVEEQGLDDRYPEFLGTMWREITDVGVKREAWEWLREWVDAFVAQYRPKEEVIRPCWFRHPDAVAELWAVANAELKVWSEQMISTMPLTGFQAFLPGVWDRLANSSMRECHDGHHEPDAFGRREPAWALRVDEQDWMDHLHSVADTECDVPAGYARMVAVSSAGTRTASQPVEVEAGRTPGESTVSTPVVVRSGDGREGLEAVATGADVVRTEWEHAQSPEGPWEVLPKSVRDVSAPQTSDETTDETDPTDSDEGESR
ncbi:hypothetical protein E4P34_09305 [Kocuria rhizophila]|uniref:DUF4913 domain-containing protein n=1 Tax=Kocuria rhizophila TaxID=72000 RepID=A0AAX2SFR4_KOCRH|nr:hypothetical protein [Kocuria rhizophila]TFI02164.1 hypothetical protein E4P33_03720 [Kocuria rhizophila]TFI05903.1 hypothetical protein E4P34_09305 [Kocuria rhizophila]